MWGFCKLPWNIMHKKCGINGSIFLSPISEQEIEDNILKIKIIRIFL